MRSIHKILIICIALLVVQCGDLPDEGTLKRKGSSVTIRYNHNKINLKYDGDNSRLSSRAIERKTPVRHNIKVLTCILRTTLECRYSIISKNF